MAKETGLNQKLLLRNQRTHQEAACSMPSFQPLDVLAFHSCDREIGLRLVNGDDELRPSENSWDWLGTGALANVSLPIEPVDLDFHAYHSSIKLNRIAHRNAERDSDMLDRVVKHQVRRDAPELPEVRRDRRDPVQDHFFQWRFIIGDDPDILPCL